MVTGFASGAVVVMAGQQDASEVIADCSILHSLHAVQKWPNKAQERQTECIGFSVKMALKAVPVQPVPRHLHR